MFVNAKGSSGLGKVFMQRERELKGRRETGRKPNMSGVLGCIFSSQSVREKLLWAPIRHFLLLALDVKIECLQEADHQWCLAEFRQTSKLIHSLI